MMNNEMIGIDMTEQEMNNVVAQAGKYLENVSEKSGIKCWEVFGGVQIGSGIKIEKGFVKRSSSSQISVITIRVYGDKGNIGSTSISRLSTDVVKKGIDNAAKMMKVSLPNPEFVQLAEPPTKYPNIETFWDSQIKDLQVEDTADIAELFMQETKRDERITSISGGFSYGDSRIMVLNSNGINIKDKGTDSSISIEYTMEDTIKGNKENSNGYDWQTYQDFKSIKKDITDIFNTGYEMAVKGLNSEKIETGSYPVVLSPMAVELLICNPISSGINAESVHQQRSFLQDKIGEKIGSDLLEINDDPWFKGGTSTGAFDVEGIPTKPLKFVDGGVLKSFLHNTYTANLFKTESTGHAARGWSSSSIGIDTSNIFVKPGQSKYQDMISDIKNGIYFEYSYDSPNIVTGEFSGLITNGYIIKDGELGPALKESMFGANLLELYGKITEVSKETIRKDSEYLPYMKISDLAISGAK